MILTPLQFYAVSRQKHPISRLLAAALTTQVVALLSISTHFLLFAFNGQGVPGLENFGDVVEICSQVVRNYSVASL
jgi:Rhodopsin-like GPCR transmembrane domain